MDSNIMNIVVVGATGLVGQELIKLLENNIQPMSEYIFVASSKSSGKKIHFNNKEYNIITLEEIDYQQKNIFINCASSKVANTIRSKMNSNNILIDNSSSFRLIPEVPLVIPEINFPYKLQQIYANPNCSTIILACLLEPLRNFGIKRVVVSTYQAASGAGKEGLEELNLQMKQLVNDEVLQTSFWRKQYVNNVMVHNSPIFNMYNGEESKMMRETDKIFNNEFKITVTCIRVPVQRSHCESVNVEFENEISYDDIIKIITKTPYLTLMDDKEKIHFPDSLSSNNITNVQVGHIRPDYSLKNTNNNFSGWNFWIAGDQLLRGAAYNAFLILDKVIYKMLDCKTCRI